MLDFVSIGFESQHFEVEILQSCGIKEKTGLGRSGLVRSCLVVVRPYTLNKTHPPGPKQKTNTLTHRPGDDMILFGNDMILYWDDMGVAAMFDVVSIGFGCLPIVFLLFGKVGPNPLVLRGGSVDLCTQTRPEKTRQALTRACQTDFMFVVQMSFRVLFVDLM